MPENNDPPKDPPADPPKDPPKDPPADPPKDPPEDPPKDPPKDSKGDKDVPEKYDLKLPKDSLLNDEAIKTVADFAKSKKLTQDQAQSILERENALAIQGQDNQEKQVEKAKADWLEQSKSDKEFGGDKFKETQELAYRAVDKYGNKALKDALNETGLGNHPEWVRFAKNIGKAMADDKLVTGAPGGTGQKKSTAEVLYGATTKGAESK